MTLDQIKLKKARPERGSNDIQKSSSGLTFKDGAACFSRGGDMTIEISAATQTGDLNLQEKSFQIADLEGVRNQAFGSSNKNESPSAQRQEPLEDVLKRLPLPPMKPLLAQILAITDSPLGACDTRPQSPQITGAEMKDTCDIELSKIVPAVEESVTQAIARPVGEQPRFGTSFLLCNDECYYVTNEHVPGKNTDEVGLVSPDGKTIQYSKILARNSERDLVIVARPEGDTRSPVRIGALPLKDEPLFVLGHPLGSPWDVMSAGKVNSTSGVVKYRDPESKQTVEYKNLIMSSVRVVPGNSGGPEFNKAGEAVGVKIIATGGGSASLPISDALDTIKKYEEEKKAKKGT